MQIRLRELQHFLYCPHRWGLIEIGDAWAENYYVVKANLDHERAHDVKNSCTSRGKKMLTAVRVYKDDPNYEIQGVTDLIECTPDPHGVPMSDGNRYSLCIVEYKPRAPKGVMFREDDAMQLFAQKLCVDSIFGCDCNTEFYYIAERKRVRVPFENLFAEYDHKLKAILLNMRRYKAEGIIPPREQGQNCNGCSLKDLCMPCKVRQKNIEEQIFAMLCDEEG